MSGRTVWRAGLAGSLAAFLLCFGIVDAQSQQVDIQETYPEPRFPKVLVDQTPGDLLIAARHAVRQTYGRGALGVAEPGRTVHVFLDYSQDMEVWEALRKAWAERGVRAVPIMGWEAAGMMPTEYEERARQSLIFGNEGWKEIGYFGYYESPYVPFFAPDDQELFRVRRVDRFRQENLRTFVRENRHIKHVFYDWAGSHKGWTMNVDERDADKFLANFWVKNRMDLWKNLHAYPADLWALVERKIVSQIGRVAEGTMVDPQGTDLHWTVTPDQAARWADYAGSFLNHLNLYPNAMDVTLMEGVVASTSNHAGFFPHMTVHLSGRGRVTKVEGGGKTGELFRHLVGHPQFRNLEFPSLGDAGYWHLSTDGFATNPKAVRNFIDLVEGTVDFANKAERNRAGVQHLAFAGPSRPGFPIDPRDEANAEEAGVPLAHTAHMHIYFPTVRWKMRDTGEWVTIVDKGWITAFDDPEVRALAARYGDPDAIFRYDWIPAIPGINVPGDYETDYAADPWKWVLSVWEKIQAGTYPYLVDDYEMLESTDRE